MNYKDIISAGGIVGQENFAQQPFYDYLVDDFLKDGMKVVEIGVCTGKSITYLADRLINKKIKLSLYGIDHFLGSPEHINVIFKDQIANNKEYLYDLCVDNLKKCNVYEYVSLIKIDSINGANKFKNAFFDVIIIDADHSYEGVKQDIDAWLPKLKTEGIIAGDDYSTGWPGVIQAVDEKFGSKVQLYTKENINPVFLPPSLWYVKY